MEKKPRVINDDFYREIRRLEKIIKQEKEKKQKSDRRK